MATSGLLKSASDVLEDGVHATKRAIKTVQRSVDELGDMKNEAVHRMSRKPLQAVGTALGIGLALGVGLGWVVFRPRRR